MCCDVFCQGLDGGSFGAVGEHDCGALQGGVADFGYAVGWHVIGKQDKEDWWIVDSKVLNAGGEKSDNHGLMMVP